MGNKGKGRGKDFWKSLQSKVRKVVRVFLKYDIFFIKKIF